MRNIALVLVAIGVFFGRVCLGATELIGNGGFESSSNAPWQFNGVLGGVPVIHNSPFAHTGNGFLSMGSINGVASEGVFQTVTIPANSLLAVFSYNLAELSSQDPAGSVEFQAIIDQNGNETTLDTEDNLLNFTNGYVQASFDVTAFAGKTINVGFFLTANTPGLGVRTSFPVDDVSLLTFDTNDIPANDVFVNAALITTTTNVSLLATNTLASKEPGEPKHGGVNGGHSLWWKWTAPANGNVVINTDNSTFDTVLAVYTGTVVSNLTQVAADDDENTSRGQLTSQVKFLATAGTQYEIAVDGKAGAVGIIQLNLSFSADLQPPKITITSPKSGSKLTNSIVDLRGTATDNLAVSLVQFRLENSSITNDFQDAAGTNSWTGTVTNLIPGPNIIRVRAFDTSGNGSTNFIIVDFSVVSPLTVGISGTGTVTPNLDNTLQEVGTALKMTAKPGAGQVFQSWSGDASAFTPALTFIMKSNMFLQANFVANPFTPIVGTYEGLFYDTNTPAHASSGSINAKVTSSGSFSAKLLLAGKSLSLSGTFSAGGFATNNIVRKGLPSVSVQLTIDLSGNGITGVLSDGTFISELNADRVVTTAGATAGKYTILIPGEAEGVIHPGGESYGTIVVSSSGAISLKGVLSDGTKLAQKANLLANGQWPFYAPLYSGNGSVFGWLTFTNGVIGGTVDWFKLSHASGKFYPNGFTNITDAIGSSYVFTPGVPVLNFDPGEFRLSNGNLANTLTNQIAINSASQITSTNSTLKLKITTSTGLFKGTVANPETGKSIAVNGVVLQKQNAAGGFFSGTNQTGRVYFGPPIIEQ